MQIQLDAADVDLFHAAVKELTAFGSRPVANNFAVAIAVLLHRTGSGVPVPNVIAQPGQGIDPVSTRSLQIDICDRTWEKDSRFLPEGAEGPIYKPFGLNFKGRSPDPNNWRNSFDPQTGLGCNAPYVDPYLASPDYLSEPRFDCTFREVATGYCTAVEGKPTCFNPNKRSIPPMPGDTEAPQRPKLLQRVHDGPGNGFWYLEPTVDVLSQLLATPSARVPLYPFAAALYCGSSYWQSFGNEITEARLAADLALGDERFFALFDPDPRSTSNARFLDRLKPRVEQIGPADYIPIEAGFSAKALSTPTPYLDRSADSITVRAGRIADPQKRADLLERATQGHRRTLNDLAIDLREKGFTVDEQFDGYDLRALRDDAHTHLFEVKTWTPSNLPKQVRHGWAQLYEYAFRNGFKSESLSMYLVLDRMPPTDYWAWEWLAEGLDVLPCWMQERRLTTFDALLERLPQ